MADDSVISIGDYYFSNVAKVVVKNKSRKKNLGVMWKAQTDDPSEKAVEVASVLGAFATYNYDQVEEVKKNTESMKNQVTQLQV